MATRKTSTALMSYDADFAAAALAESKKSSQFSSSSSFLSVSQGVLKRDGLPIPGSAINCVILAWCAENACYEGTFDPRNPESPVCFAFSGADDEPMAPHTNSAKPQHEICATCPKNQWGSDPKGGAGKACKNLRRLMLVPAGEVDERTGKFVAPTALDSTILGLKVPPTSTKGFDAYIKQVAHAMKRPSFGVYTRITVAPHAKNQLEVTFECLGNVAPLLVPQIMELRTIADQDLIQPYAPWVEKKPSVTQKAPQKRGGRY